MKRFLAALASALLLTGAGFAAAWAVMRRLPLEAVSRIDAGLAGAACGLAFFTVLAALNLLPFARRRAADWGVGQALWIVLEIMLLQFATLIFGLAACIGASLLAWRWHGTAPHMPAPGSVATIVLAGYLVAILWGVNFVSRSGRLRNRTATGIAWASAPLAAYGLAAGIAIAVCLVAYGLFRFLPPNAAALANDPTAKLFGQPGWQATAFLLIAIAVAPVGEEIVFRGGVFSAFAGRCGPLWAGMLTTALFMLVHAPEKILYPPSFLDIGLMAAAAAWLRLRYGSIRPGILLHALYNVGVMVAAGAAG
jgi:membrane protease YdiL (CAAX protease family)